MASKRSSISNFDKFSSREDLQNKISIGESGNSDVDVNVDVKVDTMPIAFAMLCSLWAAKQLSDEDFELAVRKLEDLTGKKTNKRFFSDNDITNVRLFEKRRTRR
ncbi:hypothetical protein [Domibacillus epiphyticus]|uniref:Uncharacterized protein n=1 Tax=Domibacillus epiphyticus TaxID=1714355 RepID=A0A1V2A981_9BACI|nr:hypothetical protein [Domibacillus epiphyticus]OMP67374.1 hypothetical protein BTO28_07600 [Domibacillus epiphyticus]